MSLLNKVATSVAVPWVALVLAAAGFDESRGADQVPGTLLALRLLVGLVPAVLLALGVAAAAAYPLEQGAARADQAPPRAAEGTGRGRRRAASGGRFLVISSSGIGLQRFASHSATLPQLKQMNFGERARSLISWNLPRLASTQRCPSCSPLQTGLAMPHERPRLAGTSRDW